VLKQAIRRGLARLDVGIYRLSAAKWLAGEHFDTAVLPEVDAVIDVGVAYGTPWLYERFPRAELLLIDPIPNPDLAAALDGRPYSFVECALGESAGRTTAHVDLEASALTSLLDRTQLTQHGHRENHVEVDVRTLDSVVAESLNSDGSIGLKIDTEGYEMKVLAGAEDVLRRCAFVVTEANVAERFEGSYRLDELVSFMRDHGFGVTNALSAHRDPNGLVRFLDLVFQPVR
jgi:FkbM family methyltransferase